MFFLSCEVSRRSLHKGKEPSAALKMDRVVLPARPQSHVVVFSIKNERGGANRGQAITDCGKIDVLPPGRVVFPRECY